MFIKGGFSRLHQNRFHFRPGLRTPLRELRSPVDRGRGYTSPPSFESFGVSIPGPVFKYGHMTTLPWILSYTYSTNVVILPTRRYACTLLGLAVVRCLFPSVSVTSQYRIETTEGSSWFWHGGETCILWYPKPCYKEIPATINRLIPKFPVDFSSKLQGGSKKVSILRKLESCCAVIDISKARQ